MTIPTIDHTELAARLAHGERFVLVDLMPHEVFEAKHIPGAVNACVYEVTFPDRMKDCCPDPALPVVVYGTSRRSLAAEVAAEKLVRLGYADVRVYHGGLEEWEAAGHEVVTTAGAAAVPAFRNRTYLLDRDRSVFRWTGRSIVGRHHGTIELSGGELTVTDRQPASGWFTLDMTTIHNEDLQDEAFRRLLESHLRSDDFFDVDDYPSARFDIRGIIPLAGSTPGTPGYRVTGELTLRGVARELVFDAQIEPREGDAVAGQAHFDLDRTLWGVRYGCGRLFEKLGMHLVDDLISVELQLTAR